jgi:hypothetical protein
MCNDTFPYTLLYGYIQICGLIFLLLVINLICFVCRISQFAPVDGLPQINAFYSKTCLQRSLPELHCASLTTMRVITLCRQRHRQPNAPHLWSYLRSRFDSWDHLDIDFDCYLDDYLGGLRHDDSPIYENCWYLHSHCTDEDRLDVGTQHLWMLESLHEHQQ